MVPSLKPGRRRSSRTMAVKTRANSPAQASLQTLHASYGKLSGPASRRLHHDGAHLRLRHREQAGRCCRRHRHSTGRVRRVFRDVQVGAQGCSDVCLGGGARGPPALTPA
eukprot:350404-Chlamydomonas_euryale.AAC.7